MAWVSDLYSLCSRPPLPCAMRPRHPAPRVTTRVMGIQSICDSVGTHTEALVNISRWYPVGGIRSERVCVFCFCSVLFLLTLTLYYFKLYNIMICCLYIHNYIYILLYCIYWASLVAQLVKNLSAMEETWVGKIPWRREPLPTLVFWPGEFHGLYSPWGHKSQTWLSNFHFSMLLSGLSAKTLLESCKDFRDTFSEILIFGWKLQCYHSQQKYLLSLKKLIHFFTF